MITNNQKQSFGMSLNIAASAKKLKGVERSFDVLAPDVQRLKATNFYLADERADGKLSCFAFKASKTHILNKFFERFPEAATTLHILLLRPFGVANLEKPLAQVHSSGGQELKPQTAKKLLDSANESLNIKLENRSNKP